MGIISLMMIVSALLLIVIDNKKRKNQVSENNYNGKWKKIALSLLLFIPLFYVYYIIVAIIICIPLAITMVAGQARLGFWFNGRICYIPYTNYTNYYKNSVEEK